MPLGRGLERRIFHRPRDGGGSTKSTEFYKIFSVSSASLW